MTGAPGTATLYAMYRELASHANGSNERKRAMLLSWVDELEREMELGEPGNKPRTAQIRQWWRRQGEPSILEEVP